jgi:hypothetical protein
MKMEHPMRTLKIMLAATAPGVALAFAWWFIAPEMFTEANPAGLYTSVVLGGLVGLGLVNFVLPDLIE